MNKLAWCTEIRNGIALIEPSPNLSRAYLKKAENAMEELSLVTSPDWQSTIAYYSLYFSLYSVLMRIGIRSENHTCTLEIMRTLLPAYFTRDEIDSLERARRNRIDCQYYADPVNDGKPDSGIRILVPRFYVHCRRICEELDEKTITSLRENLQNLLDST
ncbi:MAG: hypothetical protein ABFC24_09030 [Methanoregulaceae archaeon]